jgi:hypothetical protein
MSQLISLAPDVALVSKNLLKESASLPHFVKAGLWSSQWTSFGLAPFFTLLSMISFGQDTSKTQSDSVSAPTRSAMDYATDTTLTADIYLYGITFQLNYDSTEIPLSGVVITLRDLYGEATQIVSNDTAYYEFELNFDNKYQIYFEYDGCYTKYIELDTRDVIDPEKERGYVFPTDVGMEKFKSFEAAAVLLRKPIGIAAFDRRSQTMNWDFRHTDKVRNEVDKLERKEKKQSTKP